MKRQVNEEKDTDYFIQMLEEWEKQGRKALEEKQQPFFQSKEEQEEFYIRHKKPVSAVSSRRRGKN